MTDREYEWPDPRAPEAQLLAAFQVDTLNEVPWEIRADWYEENGWSRLADQMRICGRICGESR
jgi:hypothetical protein